MPLERKDQNTGISIYPPLMIWTQIIWPSPFVEDTKDLHWMMSIENLSDAKHFKVSVNPNVLNCKPATLVVNLNEMSYASRVTKFARNGGCNCSLRLVCLLWRPSSTLGCLAYSETLESWPTYQLSLWGGLCKAVITGWVCFQRLIEKWSQLILGI
jgi:hypothetical protein